MSTTISITNGEYNINSGSWTSSPGTVDNSDVVKVRRLSSPSYETTVTTTLQVGTYSADFDITTKAPEIPFDPPFIANSNYEELRFFFIYDRETKIYKGKTELIDPTGDFYGNHFVEAIGEIPPPGGGGVPYTDEELYPTSGTTYIRQAVISAVNTPEEGSGNGMNCGSTIFVKDIFTDYPSLIDLYFKIIIDKTEGPAFTRSGRFIRGLPTPVVDLLEPSFDSSLTVNCRVEKIGTDSYNVYAEATT